MRERIYFVGIRKDLVKNDKEFEWPMPVKTPKIENYLIDDSELEFDEKKRSYETFSYNYPREWYNIRRV